MSIDYRGLGNKYKPYGLFLTVGPPCKVELRDGVKRLSLTSQQRHSIIHCHTKTLNIWKGNCCIHLRHD